MNNTVVLKGKGLSVGLFFYKLSAKDSTAIHIFHDPKWWQIDTRHELRWQNLSSDDIRFIKHSIKAVGLSIKMEIF